MLVFLKHQKIMVSGHKEVGIGLNSTKKNPIIIRIPRDAGKIT